MKSAKSLKEKLLPMDYVMFPLLFIILGVFLFFLGKETGYLLACGLLLFVCLLVYFVKWFLKTKLVKNSLEFCDKIAGFFATPFKAVGELFFDIAGFFGSILKVLFWIVVCVVAIAVLAWVLWFVLKGIYGFFNYYGKFA